jgi:hypothetical protein
LGFQGVVESRIIEAREFQSSGFRVLITPLENADHDQASNALLLNGAAGSIRIGAETLESVLYVMHNSDNDDEGSNIKILFCASISSC